MKQDLLKKSIPSSKESFSRVSLIVFIILLVFSFFLTSAPEGRVSYCTIMAIFAVVSIILGPKRYRIFGVIALLFSIWLIYADYKAGEQYWELIRQKSEETNHE